MVVANIAFVPPEVKAYNYHRDRTKRKSKCFTPISMIIITKNKDKFNKLLIEIDF
jgi:hypothetical protein